MGQRERIPLQLNADGCFSAGFVQPKTRWTNRRTQRLMECSGHIPERDDVLRALGASQQGLDTTQINDHHLAVLRYRAICLAE